MKAIVYAKYGSPDVLQVLVIDGTQVKILAWYDNEWGYVNRMMEFARIIASTL